MAANPTPDLRALQVFAAVIDTGSMSGAAQRCGLTQSAVSQAVQRVEDAIGVPLLDRTRRPLAPTAAGRVLASHVRDLTQDFAKALDASRAAAVLPQRIDLRLGLVDSFASTVGAYLVKDLVDGAMALRLSAWSGLAFSHADALTQHAIDVAVTCDPMEDRTDIDRYPVLREPYLLVVPRPLASELHGCDLRDILDRYRIVRHSGRSYVGMQVERHLNRLGLRPPRVLEFDTSDALVAMVATGMGVAITTPLCLLQGMGHAADVGVLPLPGPGFSRELLIATRRGEFTDLAPRLAALSRAIIRTHAFPRIAILAPWLERDLPAMLADPAPSWGAQAEKNAVSSASTSSGRSS